MKVPLGMRMCDMTVHFYADGFLLYHAMHSIFFHTPDWIATILCTNGWHATFKDCEKNPSVHPMLESFCWMMLSDS